MVDWDDIGERYGVVVWNTVYRILGNEADALDCYQDIFLEAIQRTEQDQVKNWEAFLKWLSAHRAIDALRVRNRRFRTRSPVEDLAVDFNNDPVDAAVLDELVFAVRDELSHLPSGQAEAFWLGCIEGLTYKEIAEQMGLQTNGVGVLIHRARQQLRASLSQLRPERRES